MSAKFFKVLFYMNNPLFWVFSIEFKKFDDACDGLYILKKQNSITLVSSHKVTIRLVWMKI